MLVMVSRSTGLGRKARVDLRFRIASVTSIVYPNVTLFLLAKPNIVQRSLNGLAGVEHLDETNSDIFNVPFPRLAKSNTVTKPNVLLLLVDDLKPAMGCYGDKYAITPHMDALAKRGVRFDLLQPGGVYAIEVYADARGTLDLDRALRSGQSPASGDAQRGDDVTVFFTVRLPR